MGNRSIIFSKKIKDILEILESNKDKCFAFSKFDKIKDLIEKINLTKKEHNCEYRHHFLPSISNKDISLETYNENVFDCTILFILMIYFCYEKHFEGNNQITDSEFLYNIDFRRCILDKIYEEINFQYFIKNERFLLFLRKEILPLFLLIFNFIKNEKIIHIEKTESPDFFVYTDHKKIYVYEFTSINTNNEIKKSENLNEKINIAKFYKSILKKVKNIDKYKKSINKIVGDNSYKFQIVFFDIKYIKNEKDVQKIIKDLIEYCSEIENNKEENDTKKLLELLKDCENDTFNFI